MDVAARADASTDIENSRMPAPDQEPHRAAQKRLVAARHIGQVGAPRPRPPSSSSRPDISGIATEFDMLATGVFVLHGMLSSGVDSRGGLSWVVGHGIDHGRGMEG